MQFRTNEIFHGDCLDIMPQIPDGYVDMVLCDLPYGTTQCAWDSVIPLETLWESYLRIIKPNGAIVLTAAQPFTSVLVASNLKHFKYSWVWEKSKASGYLNAKKMPMRAHEDVCVFYKKPPTYNPQMTQGAPYNKGEAHRPTDVYGKQTSTLVKNDTGLRYPRSVQYFKTAESEGPVLHPTQKPLALFEYLIKTYTNPGELVLDNCMGVGTTVVSAINTGRSFIGIEKERKYFDISNQRMIKAMDAKK